MNKLVNGHGTGWLRDYADIRDYTLENVVAKGALKETPVRMPRDQVIYSIPPMSRAAMLGITLPSSVDLRQWCSPIEDQGPLGSCFPAGIHIRLANGSEKPIEEIRLLERVLTAEGHVGRVISTMVRMETDHVTRLILWGHRHLRLTADHPVLTKRGYVPAEELKSGDMVGLPKFLPSFAVEEISTENYVRGLSPALKRDRAVTYSGLPGRVGLATTAVALPDTIRLSSAFGRIVGLFLAEGHCDSSKAIWTFGLHEKDTLVPDLVGLLEEELEVHPHVAVRPNNSVNVTVFGTAWARLFKSLCGNGAGYKDLHPDLCSGPRPFLEAVLDGWLAGDGHHMKKYGYWAGVTISHRLALNMYDIAQGLGRHPLIQWGKAIQNSAAKTRQPRWTVITGSAETYRTVQDEIHVWRRVRAVEREDFCGPVYNLSVEGDNSYVAEGIGVHNCTAFAGIGLVEYMMHRALDRHVDVSPLFLYKATRNLMGVTGDTGAWLREALKALAMCGVAPEENWPYRIANFDTEPSGFLYALGQNYQAIKYLRLDPPGVNRLDLLQKIKAMLAAGFPVCFGFTVYDSIQTASQTGVIPFPGPGERVVAGHAMDAVGFDDAFLHQGHQGGLLVRNSWGIAWGTYGYGWLPYSYVTQGLADDWWVITKQEWIDTGRFGGA